MERRRLAQAIALLVVFFSVSPARADRTIPRQAAQTYTNPLGVDLADPDIIRHDGTYYLYGTSSDSGFRVWTSSDLVDWKAHDRLAFSKTAKSWGQQNFWAPDVLEHDGTFYLYYSSVGPVAGGRTSHRICVAQSDSPLGPFTDVKAPLLNIGKAVIDAHAFVDTDGKAYLYYALDHSENVQRDGRRHSHLYVVRLGPDLVSIVGKPVFCTRATQRWEGNPRAEDTWNEGPLVLKHKSTYILMYSARVFSDPRYAVGYATARSPLGPWTKASENPILQRTRGVSGPGHNSVIASPDGKELFVVYHTHKNLEGGHDRELNIDRLHITEGANGKVRLRVDGPTRRPTRVPSGAGDAATRPAREPVTAP